jgi:hypothetical protein
MGDGGWQANRIIPGLICDPGEGGAFGLGFDDTDSFAIYKEEVIGFASFQGEFTDSHTTIGEKVEDRTVLHLPAAGSKLFIYVLSSKFFRSRHEWILSE